MFNLGPVSLHTILGIINSTALHNKVADSLVLKTDEELDETQLKKPKWNNEIKKKNI